MRNLFLLCVWLLNATMAHAADTQSSVSTDKRIVEVDFAEDDKPPSEDFHTVTTLWLSDQKRGWERHVKSWAHQQSSLFDPDTHKKAQEAQTLLQALTEPNSLSDSSNQVVVVRCAIGDGWLVKRFPIDKVPLEIHEILIIMGFVKKDFSRLTFLQRETQQDVRQTGPSVDSDLPKP